jgi:hypothetical protein
MFLLVLLLNAKLRSELGGAVLINGLIRSAVVTNGRDISGRDRLKQTIVEVVRAIKRNRQTITIGRNVDRLTSSDPGRKLKGSEDLAEHTTSLSELVTVINGVRGSYETSISLLPRRNGTK